MPTVSIAGDNFSLAIRKGQERRGTVRRGDQSGHRVEAGPQMYQGEAVRCHGHSVDLSHKLGPLCWFSHSSQSATNRKTEGRSTVTCLQSKVRRSVHKEASRKRQSQASPLLGLVSAPSAPCFHANTSLNGGAGISEAGLRTSKSGL